MHNLAQALERFNRTEPDLLFRDAFGHSGRPLCLSASFRQRVANAVGVESIPIDAWWASEYPFNCLAGALLLYVEGEAEKEKPQTNVHALVTPGREDVDFVISFETTLILIEAKAYTHNDKPQVISKIKRLQLLRKFYLGLENSEHRPVSFNFLLTSPVSPQKLDVEWPAWACGDQKLPWMRLELGQGLGILQSVRCNADGKRSSKGRHWRIFPSRSYKQ